MKVLVSGAPPSLVVAEPFVNSAQLWGMPVSSFLKATLKAFPETTPKHFLSKPEALAPTGAEMVRLVPVSGWHGAAEPEALGWADTVGAGEGEKANARVSPAAAVATSRSLFTPSNHATASFLPSPETPTLGVSPPCEFGTGSALNCPPAFVDSSISFLPVSAHVT